MDIQWRTSSPEAQGIDSSALAELDAELSSGRHGYVDSLLIVKNGCVIVENKYPRDYAGLGGGKIGRGGPYDYFDPDWHPYYAGSALHTLQSITKSVTSALVGIAIGRGEIPGVDIELLPYFGEFSLPDRDSRRTLMTLKHVLTMTTGIRWNESGAYTDPRNLCARMEGSEDWIQFVLDQPMADEPGATFLYNSGAAQLLSYLIRKTTGMQADDYARKHLFRPLGIENYYWKRTPRGLADTEGGLYLEPRDLAKIGLLYLQNGIWDGERLLPEGWVAESTAPAVSTASEGLFDRRYGFLWWLLPCDRVQSSYAFAALGFGEQRLLVIPYLALVAVFAGWNVFDRPGLDSQTVLERIASASKRKDDVD